MKKKVLALTMAALMAASLTACGGGAKETTAADTTAADTADTTAAEKTEETSAEAAGTEAAGGVLVMATNAEFPPYEYHDGGEIVGIDAEIAKAIADELGMEWRLRILHLTPSFLRLLPARLIWAWQA